MKIRCQENSIRLRLRKSDLQTFASASKVSESVSLGVQRFVYVLAQSESYGATIEAGQLTISVPRDVATQWINTDQVGISHSIIWESGETLDLLIEKDFPCLGRATEDKSDTFFELAEKKDNVC